MVHCDSAREAVISLGTGPGGMVDIDVAVVGAGFSGLYMLHRLRGLGLRARVFERGPDVGGTWFWNRYPGARCDIESVDYCYSFSRELLAEWRWTERYATQPDILRYLGHVADRFGLRRDIQFSTQVTAARYDGTGNRWLVSTDTGEEVAARYCVLAVGNLSSVQRPDFPGLSSFRGEWYHTAQWPASGVDVQDQRVGIVGTGSTAIQALPQIAKRAARVHVFQRTPNYSMPAQNRPLPPAELRQVLSGYPARRRMAEESDPGIPVAPPEQSALEVSPAERRRKYEAGWQRGGINALSYAFTDFFSDEQANFTAQEFAREKIRQIVRDPAVASALSPVHHIGTKRTCVDIGYFQTYNHDHVELVDVRTSPITAVTPRGLATAAGEYGLDVIVFAIGFDAITGALLEIDIRGQDGLPLAAKWAAGPRTYLGLCVARFPNLFMITGPGSPSVLSNMVVSIEQHVDWITGCLEFLGNRGLDRIEASAEAEEAWVRHVNELADATLYPQAASWYVGANIPGKPRVFMPYVAGCGMYRRECGAVAERGYQGFLLGTGSPARAARAASGP
jgi:cation diffusion facilitator CzcD-associated flavoprotein CzcO